MTISTQAKQPPKAPTAPRATLQARRTVGCLLDESRRLTSALEDSDCPVFLDTNILIWSFGLNESASAAWQQWLWWLGERLVFPVWVVHEYNQHSGSLEVANPYQGLPRKLKLAHEELMDSAARALEDASAVALGCASKAELERQLTTAIEFVGRVASTVSKSDRGHRTALLKFYEELLVNRTAAADIHALAATAEAEFNTRFGMRLSPGAEDADKRQNRCGDLIIWKELVSYCAATGRSKALFLTNDLKSDWCYAPTRLIIDGGKEIAWSEVAGKGLRYPNPDLVAEFRSRTGGDEIMFASVRQIVEALASTKQNTVEATRFRGLAQAIRADRTPTDMAVDWLQDIPNAYHAAPAWWQSSPDEVDMALFESWCADAMKNSGIRLERVDWTTVFCALYL